MKLDEDVGDGLREAFVHGEAFVRPVARGTEAAELAGDLTATLVLPFPHLVDELVAGEIGALLLPLVQLPLDHHLRRDAGMIGANHPQSVLALHPGAANEDVLQRIEFTRMQP